MSVGAGECLRLAARRRFDAELRTSEPCTTRSNRTGGGRARQGVAAGERTVAPAVYSVRARRMSAAPRSRARGARPRRVRARVAPGGGSSALELSDLPSWRERRPSPRRSTPGVSSPRRRCAASSSPLAIMHAAASATATKRLSTARAHRSRVARVVSSSACALGRAEHVEAREGTAPASLARSSCVPGARRAPAPPTPPLAPGTQRFTAHTSSILTHGNRAGPRAPGKSPPSPWPATTPSPARRRRTRARGPVGAGARPGGLRRADARRARRRPSASRSRSSASGVRAARSTTWACVGAGAVDDHAAKLSTAARRNSSETFRGDSEDPGDGRVSRRELPDAAGRRG